MSDYYASVFMDDPEMDEYREQIAMPKNTVSDQEKKWIN